MTRPLVLISDDNPEMAQALSRRIELAGMESITDLDSRAFHLAKEHHPAVVIMDLDQPIDGMVLLQQITTDEGLRDVRVIVLSGHSNVELRARCLSLGAVEFVVKPPAEGFITRVADWAGAGAG